MRLAVKSLEKFPDPFLAEIGAQPDAMRRAAGGLREQVRSLERIAAVREGRRPVFTGMGASYAACHSPVTVLAQAGVPVGLADASELLHFRRRLLGGETLLVLVSQSGRSAELTNLAEGLGPDRPFLVSVTNGTRNPVAVAADAPLDMEAGDERGPSTMTFAATLVVCAAVAAVLSEGVPDDVEALRLDVARTAGSAEGMLAEAEVLAGRLEDWLGGRPRMAVLGRGTGLAAAEAGALILKEAARVPAEAVGTGQFRHGPLELAGPDLAVAIVVEPRTEELDLRLAAELVAAHAAVLVIGPSNLAVPPGAEHVGIDRLTPGLLPAVAVIPLQLLAWRLSVRSGSIPGRLTIATKVTTRE